MNSIFAWILGLGLVASPALFYAPEGAVASHSTSIAAPAEAGAVKWYTIEEAQAAMKKKPKKIFVDVYTDWCGWCKRMDKTTFEHPAVAKYLNENFYPVKFNAEGGENVIFNEKVYKPGAQAHSLAIEWLHGQMSYPTTVYLDEKLALIQPIPGYLDAKQFDAVIHFFAENQYKKKSFDDFSKDYKSNI